MRKTSTYSSDVSRKMPFWMDPSRQETLTLLMLQSFPFPSILLLEDERTLQGKGELLLLVSE